MSPERLRVEYLDSPLGMDEKRPRFSWRVADEGDGAWQSAYQIRVSSNGGTAWNSGEVASSDSSQIEYQGESLQSRRRYEWTVRLKDGEGVWGPWSATCSFETGLMGDWLARWIRGTVSGAPCQPVSYFRKEFHLDESPQTARLYITALGLYLPSINGLAVTDNRFMPGWTDYYHRVQYQAYDVTGLLQAGGNAIGIALNEGWFCGQISRLWSVGIVNYGDKPAFLAQLEIVSKSGTRSMLVSDGGWRFSTNGPIRASDIYMGENYDARLEIPGWDKRGFDDSAWLPCIEEAREIRVDWNSGPPVRSIETRQPRSVRKLDDGRWVVDWGQNVVGWEVLRLAGVPEGTEITIRHGEMLNADGSVYTANLRGARAQSIYYSRGIAEQVYEPSFTFFGFRYSEILNLPGVLREQDVSCRIVHSEMERTGWFECSDPDLNQLFENAWWGQRGNYLDVPTDCPQRDERLAWTADTQVFMRAACFNADVASFFSKWLVDLNLSRNSAGEYPQYAPFYRKDGFVAAAGWGDAGIICPWLMWEMYGDKRVLEDNFEAMDGWIAAIRRKSVGLINSEAKYKDHLNLQADTPADFVGTAFFCGMTRCLAGIATIIGRHADSQRLDALADEIQKAFQERFFTPEGCLTVGTQAAAVLALHFALVPERWREHVLEDLVHDIVKVRGIHLSTGFLGTPYLAHVLSENGRPDVAYALLKQKTYPSWLFPVTQGATTIWERWNSWTHEHGFATAGTNSFNHYAFGAVIDWFYGVICGIKPLAAGFTKVLIAPKPGGELEFAKAVFDSPAGRIVSAWGRKPDGLEMAITIPANARAEIDFPTSRIEEVSQEGWPAVDRYGIVRRDGSTRLCVSAGTHQFLVRNPDYHDRLKDNG